MAKYQLIAITLLVALLATPTLQKPKQIPEEDKELIDYWISGMGGLWHGFFKGIYKKTKSLTGKCFGDESKTELYQVLWFFGYGEFSDIFRTADQAAKFYFDNLEYCYFYQPFDDFGVYCKKDKEACTFSNLLNNAQAHLFEIFTAFSNLANIFTLKELDAPTEFYNTAYDVGHDLGKILASLFEFK